MKTRSTSPSVFVRSRHAGFCALSIICLCLIALSSDAQTPTRVWTGQDSGFWSNPNNWNPYGAPETGDYLGFEGNDSNDTMTNDLTGLSVGALWFGTANYELYGNELTLDNGYKSTTKYYSVIETALFNDGGSTTTRINCPLNFPTNSSILAGGFSGTLSQNTTDLYLNGPVQINGSSQLQLLCYANDYEGGGNGHLVVSGVISGGGSVFASSDEESGNVSPVEFTGSSPNTFLGPLYLRSYGDSSVIFNAFGATVIDTVLAVTNGATANITFDSADQIGNETALSIAQGSTLTLYGSSVTVGTILMTNVSSDALPSILDTGSTTLGLNGGIIADSESSSHHPIIKGTINLNNILPIEVDGTSNPGLEIQSTLEGIGINKTGANVLALDGNNTFTGELEISAGDLTPSNNAALSSSTSYGVVLNGGRLVMTSLEVLSLPLVVNSSNSTMITYDECEWGGPIYLNETLNLLAVDNTRTGLFTLLNGAITGAGGMLLENAVLAPGLVIISGSSPNTFSGPLIADCQAVDLDKSGNTQAYGGRLVVGQAGLYSQVTWGSYGQAPGDGEVDVYTNGIVDLNGYEDTFGPVNFNGGIIETFDGDLTISGAVTVNPADSIAYLDGAITLPPANATTFYVPAGYVPGGSDLICQGTFNGAVTSIVKQGNGTMSLAVTNDMDADTLVQQGILEMDNALALGSSPVVISEGATLNLDVNATLNQEVQLAGDGVGVNGVSSALNLAPGADVTLNGPIMLDSETTLNAGAGGNLYLNGAVSGLGPLTETGAGALTLGGGSANTYTGTTTIKQGNLMITKPDNTVAIPGNLIIGTKTALAGNSGTTAAGVGVSGSIGGTNLTVNGGSTYTILNGDNQTLSSVTLVNGGSISTGALGTLALSAGPDGDVVTVSPGQSGASVIGGNVYLINGGNFVVNGRSTGGATPELDLTAGLNDEVAGGVTKSGAGQLQFSGANAFSSALTVNGGKLTLANASALGNSASTTVNNNSILVLDSGVTIQNNSLTLNTSNGVALQSLSGSNAWTGPVTLSQTCAIDVQPGSGYLDFQGPMSGPGGLTTVGSGTVQLLGTNLNTYTGLTSVGSGLLEAGRWRKAVHRNIGTGLLTTNLVAVTSMPGDVSIGSDAGGSPAATLQDDCLQQMTFTANLAVHASGLLNYIYLGVGNPLPGDETVQTLTGSGQVNLLTNGYLIINNSAPFSFYGTITGNGAFTKGGAGTMTTWGNIDTPGNIDLAQGDWELFGQRSIGGILVNGNARLGGDGTIDGPVIATSATIGVDSHFPDHQGSAMHMGSLSNSTGVTIQLDMFGPTATGGNDQIATTAGGVVLASDTLLSAAFDYPPRQGDVIDLISVPGGQSISGTFANFSEGVRTLVGQIPVVPSYHGGAGNDFTLTVANLGLSYSSYQLAEGNGNQTVEPDECNLLYVSLVNSGSNAITITNAYLRATNKTGVVVTTPVATFPTIPAGQTAHNSTPFQFRTDTNLPCGGAVGFELALSAANLGQIAVDFSPVSGTDCSHPTGACESCTTAVGQFTNALTTSQPLYFVGSPSLCYPPKAYPGTNPAPNAALTPYLTHSFTNDTTNTLCLTAQLNFPCADIATNALGVAAYVGDFDPSDPSAGYAGDIGEGGPPYPTFSFQVPAKTNFTLVVMQQATNLVCDSYTIELFGLSCPPPTLVVEPDTISNKLRVDWSTAYPGWVAQRTSKLNGTFTNAPLTPSIVQGRYALTNISPTADEFYRLKN